MIEKRRRPGKGPIPRGATQARREAATARRLLIAEGGTPRQRGELRLPLTGSIDFLERFWFRVGESTERGCTEWLGQIDDRHDQGYGVITLGHTGYRAHRIAWEMANAEQLPTEIFACHDCDNPRCCNPEHVFPGTVVDNNRDSARKGRNANGRKTHCKRGHLLGPDNLAPDKRIGVRKCRICSRWLAEKNYRLRIGQPERVPCAP